MAKDPSEIELIDFALHFGAEAHYDVAMVVHKMFESAWSYIPRRGWRVLEDGRCYNDDAAILKIKELLSRVVHQAFLERARYWRTEAERTSATNADKATEIAASLLNATYKAHILDECMIFFLCV